MVSAEPLTKKAVQFHKLIVLSTPKIFLEWRIIT